MMMIDAAETTRLLRPLPSPRRRGVALLMVLSAVAVATLLAYSVLSTTSLRRETADARYASARAANLAESGVELAKHFLLHPDQSPVALAADDANQLYYPGQAGFSLAGGAVDVAVEPVGDDGYRIRAVGRATAAGGEVVERPVEVEVRAARRWSALAAVQFNGYAHFDGSVEAKGGIAADGDLVVSRSKVPWGLIYAANWNGKSGWAAFPHAPLPAAPEWDDLTLVRDLGRDGGRYRFNGGRHEATVLVSSLLPDTLGPTASNPAGVYVWDQPGPLRVGTSRKVVIQGTLVVTQGDLVLGEELEIRPKPGMPALLVRGSLRCEASRVADLNGVTWLGSLASGAGKFPQVRTKGCLLFGPGGGSRLAAEFRGELFAKFDAAKAVPDLAFRNVPIERLDVTRWSDR